MSDRKSAQGEDDVEDVKMSLYDHLIELRQRLIRSFVALILLFFVCYYFAADLYDFLVRPLADVVAQTGGDRRLIYTALQEAFFTYVKVAFFAAFFVGFPFIATQIWGFIAPGLYKHEKRAVLPVLMATPVLFFLGGALVYYFIFPLAWKFFLSFESAGGPGTLPIQLEAKVDEYLSLVMRLIFAFGLVFELPVVMTVLARVGVVTSKGLAEKRRYAIVIVFIVAAVLTPPDVISQIGLALPTLALYEISILAVRMVERKMRKAAEAAGVEVDEEEEAGATEETAGQAEKKDVVPPAP